MFSPRPTLLLDVNETGKKRVVLCHRDVCSRRGPCQGEDKKIAVT